MAEGYCISNDQDFLQLCDDKTILLRPGKKEQVLNKKKVLEEYGIHPRNFAWARAVVGDKSDNLEGVRGLGLKRRWLRDSPSFRKIKTMVLRIF